MKTLISSLFFIIFHIAICFQGCSDSNIIQEKQLELLNKESLDDQTILYSYKYGFNGEAWMEVNAYVKKENTNYIISINNPIQISLSTYIYKSDLDEQNLIATNRVRLVSVSSLEEAIIKSILLYLQDNI